MRTSRKDAIRERWDISKVCCRVKLGWQRGPPQGVKYYRDNNLNATYYRCYYFVQHTADATNILHTRQHTTVDTTRFTAVILVF